MSMSIWIPLWVSSQSTCFSKCVRVEFKVAVNPCHAEYIDLINPQVTVNQSDIT